MFHLSKKTEYGVMALSYLSLLSEGDTAKVGDISHSFDLPRELLAKILSELVKAGLAQSYPGPNGGFRLTRPANHLSLAEIVDALESKSILVDCTAPNGTCVRTSSCRIRKPMNRVYKKMQKVLTDTKLSDLLVTNAATGIKEIQRS
jgi:Rrf2 family iron-sulfur cluster assembly transcriptional regulator